GNIYVDEVLFLSKVHPERRAHTLTDEEIRNIVHYTKEVLETAVEQGGTTIRSYVDGEGEMGMFQQALYAYGQESKPCKHCGTDMTVVIGLTGSIGTGKSTIAKRLEELGAPIVDADLIAREVVEPGKTAYQQIVAAFGEKILYEDGSLNRTVLGNIVFQDEVKRKQLNEIIHPEIRK